MSIGSFIINGHFKKQQVTGVQRYALELLKEFDQQGINYSTIEPPKYISSDSLRQLWMQTVMPLKTIRDSLLWSPTNIGPLMCENQVLTLHDIAAQLHPEWFDSKFVQWQNLILPKLLKRVRRIITVSHFSRQTIVERYPQTANKIEVIYNGVRTEHFYPRRDEQINQLKRDFNLSKPFILTVGSLDQRKNLQGLIKAWYLLPDWVRNELDLVVAGASARMFSFSLDEKYDKTVRFAGYIQYQDLPILYSAATLFIYPSLFEGFGLPVLEAMACGTPVITSGTTALKEVAGNVAKVVNPESIDEIRSAILTLVESSTKRLNMISEGFVWSSRFTWKKTADQTYDCLRDAL